MPEIDASWSQIGRQIAAEVVAALRENPPIISPWMNPVQAAAYVGFKERGLETMRRRGDGPKYSRVNHRVVRYHVKHLDAWLREHVERRGGAK